MAAQNTPQLQLDPRYASMVEAEKKILKRKYKEPLPGKELPLDRLIEQAARCKTLLDLEFEDISKNGTTELFSQSPTTKPYERMRPVAQLYLSREKNYISILKHLDGLIQKAQPQIELDELDHFLR